MATTFRLQGGPGLGLDDLALGPWIAEPPRDVSADEPHSFAADPDGGPEPGGPRWGPRWCVDIDQLTTGGLAAAHLAFDSGEQSVRATQAKLDDALGRIDRAVELSRRTATRDARASAADGPLAFSSDMAEDAPPAIHLPRAEASLLADLAAFHGHQTPATNASGALSFAAGHPDDDPDEMDETTRQSRWRSLAEAAGAALDQVTRVATYPSWVETRVAGRLLARSAISWTGDTENLAIRRLPPELIAVHTRSVSISLRTRNAWSRLLITVVHGSAKLMAVTGPTGALMAVPTAWKFVRRIVTEVKELRAIDRA